MMTETHVKNLQKNIVSIHKKPRHSKDNDGSSA